MDAADLTDEESLRLALRRRDEQLEEKKQEVYQLQLNLKAQTSLVSELTHEQRTLQDEVALEKQRLTEGFARQKAALSRDHKEKETELEAQLELKTAECCHLCTELEELRQLKPERSTAETEVLGLRLEVAELHQELAELSHSHAALQQQHEQARTQAAQLTSQLEEATQLHSHSMQRCEDLKQKLNDCREELERAQEEGQAAQLQLLALQGPAKQDEATEVGQRGNSLFSEVEDNRQAAMNSLKSARADAALYKKEALRVKLELQALKMENAMLHKKWTDFQENSLECLDQELMKEHKKVIEELEQHIQQLESKLVREAGHLLPGVLSQHKWLNTTLMNHQKELNELNSKLREMRLKMMVCQQNEVLFKQAERNATAECMNLRGQLKALTLQLEKFKGQTSGTDDTKENCPDNKSENVIDSKMANFMAFMADRKKNHNKNVQFSLPASSVTYAASNQDQDKARLKQQPVLGPAIVRIPAAHKSPLQTYKSDPSD